MPREKKTVRTNFRIPEDLYKKLKKRATEAQLKAIETGEKAPTMTEIVVEALRKYLK